jgi:predicted transcriptional regulator
MGMPTFRGRHNSLKCKVLWLLSQEYNDWHRPREISDVLGVNMHSLLTALKKWTDWHRVKRRKHAGYYEYQITQKGLKWFHEWSWLMPLSRYKAEIRAWQEKGVIVDSHGNN